MQSQFKSQFITYNLKDWVERNKDNFNWIILSDNPNAINLLEKNIDKIDWFYLSGNPNAIKLLEQNIDKIDWEILSGNLNAIELLEKNIDKIDWFYLLGNSSIFNISYNYPLIKKRIDIIKEELLIVTLYPDRIMNWIEQGFMINNLFYYNL